MVAVTIAELKETITILEEQIREKDTKIMESQAKLDNKLLLLDAIIDRIPVFVSLDKKEGKILRFNDYDGVTGYTKQEIKEEVIGQNWFDLFLKTDKYRKNVENVFEQLKKDPESEYVNPIYTKNNDQRLIYWRNKAVFDKDRNISEIIAIGVDITEQERLKEDLVNSNNKFMTIAEKSPVGIVIIKGGQMVYVNNKICEITGYTQEDFIGWKLKDFFKLLYSVEDQKKTQETYKSLVTGKTSSVTSVENKIKNKKGKIEHVLCDAIPIKYNGEPAIMGTILPITDRKILEEKLTDSLQAYKSFFENSADALVILNPDSFILNTNSQFRGLFGYDREDLEKEINFLDFAPTEEERERLRQYRDDRLDGKNVPPNYETRLKLKDGSIRDFNLSASTDPLTKDIIVSLRDITDKKKLEEAKEKATRDLQYFLDGIIHDFGNLLLKIRSSSELIGIYFNTSKLAKMGETITKLEEELEDDANKQLNVSKLNNLLEVLRESYEASEFVKIGDVLTDLKGESDPDKIRSNVKRLIEYYDNSNFREMEDPIHILDRGSERAKVMIEDTRNFRENSTLKYNFVKCNMHNLIESELNQYTDEFKQANLVVENTVDPNLVIVCDKGKISDCIKNFIQNLFKYNLGKNFRNRAKFGYNKTEDGLHHFYIKDNGKGIAKNDLPNVGKPYQRFGDKNEVKGTGLGLFNVMNYIEGHGGKFWAESEGLLKGSTFNIIIPDLKEGEYA